MLNDRSKEASKIGRYIEGIAQSMIIDLKRTKDPEEWFGIIQSCQFDIEDQIKDLEKVLENISDDLGI